MIFRPDRRRRLRLEKADRPEEPDDRIRLARPRRTRLPWVVVALLGFLAGAIVLQSFWGGMLGGVMAVLIREALERAV
jgi:uncharacterized membrane protein YidH (DUF202 family)